MVRNTIVRNAAARLLCPILVLWLAAGCVGTSGGGGTGGDGKADGFFDPSGATRTMCAASEASPCLADDPVRVESALSEWTEQLAAVGDVADANLPLGLTECRWVFEVQGALLCGVYRLDAMNGMLARATMYIEGMVIGRRGEIVSTVDSVNETAARSIGGHDLRWEDLTGFYDAVADACLTEEPMCLTPSEAAMHDLLERAAEVDGDLVVIAFAIRSPLRPYAVVGHEILHAQYFLEPDYREAVDLYWANIPADERQQIVDLLAQDYDAEDELLMRNEFQAYILDPIAHSNLLEDFVDAHQEPLTAALVSAGTPPVHPEPEPAW